VPKLLVSAVLGLVLAVMIGLSRDKPGFTTVYVVRHAEAEHAGDDPGLTDVGVARAEALASLLRSADLDAVYSSPTQRTMQTAAPTALVHELDVSPYPPKDAEGLAERIARDHVGQTLLVVGHSNTVPMIVQAFGAGTIDDIAHDEHDNLYVVTIAPNGDVGIQRLRIPRDR